MKNIIVTTSWDDGHRLDLRLADLLCKYGIQATLYIAPDNREFAQEQLLNGDQIRALSQKFEIGAHTLTHPHLTDLQADIAYSEIAGSKEFLEQVIGKTVSSFCYPAGLYTSDNINQVKRAGFNLARTTKRFSTYPLTKPFELATTVHVYNHFFNPTWDRLAIDLFDKVRENGGVYHLWGHSWEIDNHRDWQKLENVFKYIGNSTQVSYVANHELL